ncbi:MULTISPECIES: 16S rRNA (guanine(966)-N(2))-methyltransferase RsmD [unclassified Saccharibacter]|uniref:16S rRNA (guanine(966)-N(2))-methyltransferase RsmD n=1 Tax=unclassified Saccharibacter TaxID=2648722 RepID=UPI001322509F|nr:MULTISPECIES: 16S rRNA (guanine(966)-N(2))-methyltransferase RsmD [unclassified Saccharibacter]MXV35163.1 16S rRNA (guanine(966)-N(2))-methyltransferase RsmD [Saccharibacter sp. EH611]MXV57290.1 16S rRNA (guanine(966)-N(2))-methyltransferase RsmD [Saccharibacter sp. EH70]MXV64849.1 16S rRNA (guanine(966)-N(2))-methyltransferase RsmD [Saccharibacter sp. EH60]
MRIIAGAQRGRTLLAPKGATTRPTSQRMRQAVFDMLMHAPWYGREQLEQAIVLDAFAGTGALGLEALSRGARFATFMESSRTGVNTLRDNLLSCKLSERARLRACDVTHPPKAPKAHTLIFLDPPYHKGLVEKGLRALSRAGWVAEGALIVAETEQAPQSEDDEPFEAFHAHLYPGNSAPPPVPLAQRSFGVGRITIWQHTPHIS